jgi:hypothetical protein
VGSEIELSEGAVLTTLPDGTALVTVTTTTWRGRRRVVGVYTVADGRATWVPAVDGHLMALIGTSTGFVAALLGTLAVLRRPPWPHLDK